MPAARKDTTPITLENPDFIGTRATVGDYTVAFESLRGVMDPAPLFKGLPPGHLPLGEPGTELMTLSRAAELDKVTAALARNARELPGGSEA